MQLMLKIKITNRDELRMGSPYNICNIELPDLKFIDLPKAGWQDKYALSNDSKTLVLIKWNLEGNNPGFHFFIIDTITGAITRSERIAGLVNEIHITGNRIQYNKFLYDKSKPEAGSLCCNIDAEYVFRS